ncbi:hypothetical protein BDY19DRAFT_122499 [Irpex rosettiformis]|uniref:Uncharacterized protein n=1 Tax=Irpex rosettiformis TaxID=378272 RepID=A0ACB8U510_9APHY|nr:hypothetical protein BDY19DRAFT_122499 [Irpex rosettiformis]
MPTIPVNDEGAVLYYEDSGAPQGAKDYSTIFLLHGFIFHGATFRPSFQHALSKNIRMVAINQREYPGSSPLNDHEIANVWSSDPNRQANALREQAVELAVFMARFIDGENIPAPKRVNGQEVGGVSFLAWSQGNGPLLSLLANISQLDNRTNAVLERYMRTVFVYDPPSMILGVPSPPDTVTPIDNPEVPFENKAQEFIDWAAAYWNPLQTPESITTEALVNRYDMHKATQDDQYLPTSVRLPKNELDALTSPEILPRVGVALSFHREVYAECLRRALFDTKGRWRNLRVVALWPDMTIWPCSLGGRALADMISSPAGKDAVRRDMEMVRINGVNHFYHYAHPAEFTELIERYL